MSESETAGFPGGALVRASGVESFAVANVRFRDDAAPAGTSPARSMPSPSSSFVDLIERESESAAESKHASLLSANGDGKALAPPAPAPAPAPLPRGALAAVDGAAADTASTRAAAKAAAQYAREGADDFDASTSGLSDVDGLSLPGAEGGGEGGGDVAWEKKQEQLEDAFQHHLDVLERMQQHAATIRAHEAAEEGRRAAEETELARIAAEQRRGAEAARAEAERAEQRRVAEERRVVEQRRQQEEVAALQAEVERMREIENRRTVLLEEKRAIGEALHAQTLSHGHARAHGHAHGGATPPSRSPQAETQHREETRCVVSCRRSTHTV